MNVVVPIPDSLAARFGSEAELSRRVVEALALEEYRAGRLTPVELRQVLGFATQGELDHFLARRHVAGQSEVTNGGRNATDDLIARFQAFATTHSLGGLAVKDLIGEGRR